MRVYTATNIQDILDHLERDRSWLARKMGVDPSYVHHVILGRRRITRNFATRACAALDLPESALFTWRDIPDGIPASETEVAGVA